MVSGEVPAVFEGDAGRNAMPATFFSAAERSRSCGPLSAKRWDRWMGQEVRAPVGPGAGQARRPPAVLRGRTPDDWLVTARHAQSAAGAQWLPGGGDVLRLVVVESRQMSGRRASGQGPKPVSASATAKEPRKVARKRPGIRAKRTAILSASALLWTPPVRNQLYSVHRTQSVMVGGRDRLWETATRFRAPLASGVTLLARGCAGRVAFGGPGE